VPIFEFFLKELRRSHDIGDPEGKRAYFAAVAPFLRRINNPAERAHYMERVSEILGMKVDLIYQALGPATGARPGVASKREDATKGEKRSKKTSIAEETILKVVLRHPELYGDDVAAAIARFKDPLFKEVGGVVSASLNSGKPLNISALSDDIIKVEGARDWIAGALFNENDGFVESPEKMLEDCIGKVFGRKLKKETLELIKKLEEAGRDDAAREIRARAERSLPREEE